MNQYNSRRHVVDHRRHTRYNAKDHYDGENGKLAHPTLAVLDMLAMPMPLDRLRAKNNGVQAEDERAHVENGRVQAENVPTQVKTIACRRKICRHMWKTTARKRKMGQCT